MLVDDCLRACTPGLVAHRAERVVQNGADGSVRLRDDQGWLLHVLVSDRGDLHAHLVQRGTRLTASPRSVRRTALTTPMISKGLIHQVESATVRDRDGATVGKVTQVFPSDEDGSAAYVSVATGLLGRHQTLVPVEDATFDGTDLHVGYTKDAIQAAPSLGPEHTLSLAEANAVRKHFGLSAAGAATGDMGDPNENLDQARIGPAGADDTEGAGTTPPA